MKKVLVCFAIILPALIMAQVTEEWVARYNNGFAYSLALDNNGNVYVAGQSTYMGLTTIKYDSAGEEQWVAYGPGTGMDFSASVVVDASSNAYVTGTSDDDFVTIKYNPSGEEQWVSLYNGPGDDTDWGSEIALDGSGNVYVTGLSSTGAGVGIATIKYNTYGEEQWVARYEGVDIFGFPAIAVDDGGNVFITGGNLSANYVTIKYNTDGDEEWVTLYDGPAHSLDWAVDVTVDGSGNVYVTGMSMGQGTFTDYATIKYNSSGKEQWVARYNGPGDYCEDIGSAITLDHAGNVYVTGSSSGVHATVKYSPEGEELWSVRSENGGSNCLPSIATDVAGNVYVAGTRDGSGFMAEDYATIKYTADGLEQWVQYYNGTGNSIDRTSAIAVDKSEYVYITGGSMDEDEWYDYVTIKYSQGPGVAEASRLLPGHRLGVAQLAPEPVITYTLPSSSSISLKVYDVTGKLVRTLVSESQEAGTHTVTWDARNDSNRLVSAGLYFILLETRDFRATGKLVVAR